MKVPRKKDLRTSLTHRTTKRQQASMRNPWGQLGHWLCNYSARAEQPLQLQSLLPLTSVSRQVLEVFPYLQIRPSIQGQLKVIPLSTPSVWRYSSSTEYPKTTQGRPSKYTEYPKILKVADHPCHGQFFICIIQLKHKWPLKNVKTYLMSLKYFCPSKLDRVSENNSRSSH